MEFIWEWIDVLLVYLRVDVQYYSRGIQFNQKSSWFYTISGLHYPTRISLKCQYVDWVNTFSLFWLFNWQHIGSLETRGIYKRCSEVVSKRVLYWFSTKIHSVIFNSHSIKYSLACPEYVSEHLEKISNRWILLRLRRSMVDLKLITFLKSVRCLLKV